jgi:hypothetical protein
MTELDKVKEENQKLKLELELLKQSPIEPKQLRKETIKNILSHKRRKKIYENSYIVKKIRDAYQDGKLKIYLDERRCNEDLINKYFQQGYTICKKMKPCFIDAFDILACLGLSLAKELIVISWKNLI